MNNKFTARMKVILLSFSLLFTLSFGEIKAVTTSFTTDTTWRVTSTVFPSWNTIPYVLNSSWLVPGGGNTNCGVSQTGVVGVPKIWFPASNSLRTCYFRKKFTISQLCDVKTVTVEIAAADNYVLYINGIAIASGGVNAKTVNIPTQILQCENVIAVQARDTDAKCWWMAARVNISTTPLTFTASSNSPATNPICAGQTLNLTSTGLSGATYAWTGPNGFTSNLQNPTLPNAGFNASGVYTVVVNVGKCCRYSATISVNIKECAECLEIIQKEITCKNGVYYETFCVKNNSSHTATNINLISTTPNITYMPNILTPPGGLAPGQTFCTTVVLGGSGAVAGASACFNAMLVEIKQCQQTWFCVSKNPLCVVLPACLVQIPCDSVKLGFSPNVINLCLGDSVQLNPNTNPLTGLTYLWIPATGLSSAIIKNPWAKPTVTTTYNLIVSVPNSTCKKDGSITVVVKPCTTNTLCDWRAAVKDTVLYICKGTSTTLSASTIPAVTGASYAWTSSPTSTIVGGNTPNPTVTPSSSPTIYTVTITTGSTTTGQLCVKTATVKVFWKDCGTTAINCDSVKVSFSSTNVTICLGDSVQLNPITNPVSGLSYEWVPPTGLSNAAIKNPWAKPTTTTTYYVVAGIPNTDCKKKASITVTVNQCTSIPNSQRKTTEEEVIDDIQIAPNPTHSIISVQIPDSMNWEKAMLINAQGIILNEQERIDEAKSVKFDVHTQPSGMYIIRVKTDKGFVNKKVMKE